MNLFGIQVAWNDPALYLIAWVTVTLALVGVAATGQGELAVGFAASALLGVVIVTQIARPTQRGAAPATPGSAGASGFPSTAGSGGGGGGGGSW